MTKIAGCIFLCVFGFDLSCLSMIRDANGGRNRLSDGTYSPLRIQPCHGPDGARGPILVLCQKASEKFLKVGCVNRPANGLTKGSLLFRTWPLPTEGVSTRLISGDSPEVPPALRASDSGGASTQTRLMEP